MSNSMCCVRLEVRRDLTTYSYTDSDCQVLFDGPPVLGLYFILPIAKSL